MKNFFLNIAPKRNSGFCNQIYSINYTCGHCVRNNINFIFLGKFLKEINATNFCNISEILDINATNNYLKQYNLSLVDYYNFNFDIINASYGINNAFVNVTEPIKNFLKNNVFYISKTVDLNSLCVNPVEFYKKKYFIDIDPKKLKLSITFKINNITFQEEYEQTSGFLNSDAFIDLENVSFNTSRVQNDQSNFTIGIFRNITFQQNFMQRANEYIERNISRNKKINCIHLRLENDAVEHWAKENNMHTHDFKTLIEEKYISAIKNNLEKSDTTIVLSGNYDNRVMKYMKENGYNCIETPKMSENREIAAIYDLHIGQHCNNVYILVYDSSFSYTLLYRIYEQTKFKPIELNYILK